MLSFRRDTALTRINRPERQRYASQRPFAPRSPSAPAKRPMETRDHLEAAPRPPQKHGWMNWFYEIVALAFSTAALASVAVLLATQDGSLVTDWDFPLSINTVVAILGVVNKATLAFVISACIGQHKWNMFKGEGGKLALFEQFDEASRGPWGGLGLMFRSMSLLYSLSSVHKDIISICWLTGRAKPADCT